MPGLSPKLPLHIDQIDGYALTKDFKQVAAQNLKMVVMTNPGERIMIPEFGVGIKTYLFENATSGVFDFSESPIEPSSLSNYVHLQIKYRIPSLFISDTLSLEI